MRLVDGRTTYILKMVYRDRSIPEVGSKTIMTDVTAESKQIQDCLKDQWENWLK